MQYLTFKSSAPFSIGVELELQIVNTRDYNLTRGASDLLARLERAKFPGIVKPEITESMIELNSGVAADYATLVVELQKMRDAVVAHAERLNLSVCGGGAHPFQKWSEQRIYSAPRFNYMSDLYGYLAKQFTVFGQHIHIGCTNGDDAIRLTHLMSRYIPHFIALSASSPFYQGVDTNFDSARVNAVNAFPLSGFIPYVETWDEFNDYFAKMHDFRIVASMKDFYWDIRPKPEFGTIEIRICDTPLTVEKAAQLGAYAQALSRWLMTEAEAVPSPDVYLLYNYNRFQACRFGLNGYLIDPYTKNHVTLMSDVMAALDRVMSHAEVLGSMTALNDLREEVRAGRNGSVWLRERHQESGSLTDVVRSQAALWAGRESARALDQRKEPKLRER